VKACARCIRMGRTGKKKDSEFPVRKRMVRTRRGRRVVIIVLASWCLSCMREYLKEWRKGRA
jgi:hypothetical protein